MDEASRGKHERESDKINYMKDIGLEALTETVGREDEWEAGDSMQGQKRCRRGWRQVKEHAGMDEATVVAFMLVSFGPQLSMDI